MSASLSLNLFQAAGPLGLQRLFTLAADDARSLIANATLPRDVSGDLVELVDELDTIQNTYGRYLVDAALGRSKNVGGTHDTRDHTVIMIDQAVSLHSALIYLNTLNVFSPGTMEAHKIGAAAQKGIFDLGKRQPPHLTGYHLAWDALYQAYINRYLTDNAQSGEAVPVLLECRFQGVDAASKDKIEQLTVDQFNQAGATPELAWKSGTMRARGHARPHDVTQLSRHLRSGPGEAVLTDDIKVKPYWLGDGRISRIAQPCQR